MTAMKSSDVGSNGNGIDGGALNIVVSDIDERSESSSVCLFLPVFFLHFVDSSERYYYGKHRIGIG